MVNTTCAMRECMSTSRSTKDVRFHQFPVADERIKQWLVACDREDLYTRSLESLRNTHVCSLHFEPHMYGKKALKRFAVPTLHMPPKGKTSVFTQTDTLELLKRNPNNSTAVAADIDGRAVISRVFYYLRQEYEDLKSLTDNSSILDPLSNILQRTAAATGIHEALIKLILDQELLLGTKNHAASEKQMKLYLQRSVVAGSAQAQLHVESTTSSKETPPAPKHVKCREQIQITAKETSLPDSDEHESQESSSSTEFVTETEVMIKIENDGDGGPVDLDPLDTRSDATGQHGTASDVKTEQCDDNQPQQEQDILLSSADHSSSSFTAHTTIHIEPTVVGTSQVSGTSVSTTTNISVNLQTEREMSPVRKRIKMEHKWSGSIEADPLHSIKIEEHHDQLPQTDKQTF